MATKEQAIKIFISAYQSIKNQECIEVSVGKIEMILKELDEIAKNDSLALDKIVEPVTPQQKESS